jgi:hypothetical protein
MEQDFDGIYSASQLFVLLVFLFIGPFCLLFLSLAFTSKRIAASEQAFAIYLFYWLFLFLRQCRFLFRLNGGFVAGCLQLNAFGFTVYL